MPFYREEAALVGGHACVQFLFWVLVLCGVNMALLFELFACHGSGAATMHSEIYLAIHLTSRASATILARKTNISTPVVRCVATKQKRRFAWFSSRFRRALRCIGLVV